MAVSMTTSVRRWTTASLQRDGDVETSASCHPVAAVGAGVRVPAHALGADVIDSEFRCGGCRETLTVYHHFSRRHHAYLGCRADSEDLT
ncbi:hypothetical protein [Rhodococcus opacus]|uniref:hypothetical protein n=2 Tax=Rhodococcus opacus TaxID=37919 RepID=UPI00146F3D7F|nr:hypothetical protein [Rhodococcus opacus]MDJ0419753.1 hypothetical protein [Rhodococcus opacus]